MNQFVRLNREHINVDAVELFAWRRWFLEVHFVSGEYIQLEDTDKKEYYKLCSALGVEPWEVE